MITEKKPIKIMHVLHSLDVGGLENGVINLINNMNYEKFIHSICCISKSGTYAEKVIRKDVEIFEMNKREGNNIMLPLRLAGLFRKSRVDVVHTRNWGAVDGIIGAWLAGVPVLIHGEHGREITDPEGNSGKRNLIRRGLSRFVDRYITVSDDLHNWLIKSVGIDSNKVQTICNGVDIEEYQPGDKEASRSNYGYGSEDVIIGTVGRLDPVKDQQLLVQAIARLKRRHQNIILVIIGDGPCREEIEKQVLDRGLEKNVHMLGMRSDVKELLRIFDIFVLPSIAEGISNTVLEAMATGLPVVATHVGGNPHLVVDGKTGYLIPKQDLNALTGALEHYILNRTSMINSGHAARKRAVNEFALNKMVSEYEAVYTELLAKSN